MSKKVKINKWDKYNYLTIINQEPTRWRNRYVKCLCDCWNKTILRMSELYHWRIKSCWCYYLWNINKRWHHKMYWTKFHKTWIWIKNRCNDKENPNYWWRWIVYCDKRDKFDGFKDDMYESYLKHIEEYWTKQTSIDRIDNNWNYCKENCKRSTRMEQSNNVRRNRLITHNWETHTIRERSVLLWIKHWTLSNRIYNRKLSVEKILSKELLFSRKRDKDETTD